MYCQRATSKYFTAIDVHLPELLDLCESSIDLVTHGRDHIVDRDHAFLIDESLGPDLSIHLVSRCKMLTNIILLLGNRRQLLASVNVNATLRLAKHRTASKQNNNQS